MCATEEKDPILEKSTLEPDLSAVDCEISARSGRNVKKTVAENLLVTTRDTTEKPVEKKQ